MKASESLKEEFYGLLDRTLNAVPARDRIMLHGDFSVRVGTDSEESKKILGKHRISRIKLTNLCCTRPSHHVSLIHI